ncbi:MAG TPA: CcmD family protein [Bryobacteraceae bacterium]|nr:CcmD family protein [Bryobacteraceae bacterium]
MHAILQHMLLAQVSPQDITLELERLKRNFEFLSYGFTAAWVILIFYVLLMAQRGRKLKREIASLKAMLEEREKK